MEYSMPVMVSGALKREFDDKETEYELFVLKHQYTNPMCRGAIPFKIRGTEETFESLADDADYPISGWIKVSKLMQGDGILERVVEIRIPKQIHQGVH